MLGSLSGVIGGIQGLLILGLVLTFGYLLRQITPVHWLSAFCQAVLLYWLILPQGGLVSLIIAQMQGLISKTNLAL